MGNTEDERLDPSVNIGEVEEKIARSRRTSRMESEAVAKQKLLQRLKSYSFEKDDQLSDEPKSPTTEGNLDPSVKSPQEVEDRISKTRRQSHSSYQHKLSLKRENLSKKRSANSESSPTENKVDDPI